MSCYQYGKNCRRWLGGASIEACNTPGGGRTLHAAAPAARRAPRSTPRSTTTHHMSSTRTDLCRLICGPGVGDRTPRTGVRQLQNHRLGRQRWRANCFWQHNWGLARRIHPRPRICQVESIRLVGSGVDVNQILKPQFGQVGSLPPRAWPPLHYSKRSFARCTALPTPGQRRQWRGLWVGASRTRPA